jgi:hypothetical protein
MYGKAFSIVVLLAIVIATPIVDAIACDDCKDIIPLREMQQSLPKGADHSDGDLLLSEAGHQGSSDADAAQDLCPICADVAASMGNANFGAPSLNGQVGPLPKLIAFSDPSYSINKPPQN